MVRFPVLLVAVFQQMVGLSFASHYNEMTRGQPCAYELMCPENEMLQDTMPCCEPTCDNDCSNAKCAEVYVRQPTCVCKAGYVRHKGKCIQPCHCPPRQAYPPTCAENEELLPSPPCCEPTCTDDCTDRVCHTRYVDQPTCVCKKGYRRHNGKCIRVDQCPSCGPYATLNPCAPCCEPTCDNDCSNVLCIAACQGDPVCVCQQGYVKNNGTCIKRELCPRKGSPPKHYCRCSGRKKSNPSPVHVVYDYPVAPSVTTPPPYDRYQRTREELVPPTYYAPSVSYPQSGYGQAAGPVPTYPPAPYGPPATYAPRPAMHAAPATYASPPPNYEAPPAYAPQTAQSCGCNIQHNPCPYAPSTPKPYYQQPLSSYQDQPYYAIPALKQCACGTVHTPAAPPRPSCPDSGNYDQPMQQMYNHPPISFNVDTPPPCTSTAAPPVTPCPGAVVIYNPLPYAPYQPPSYQYGYPVPAGPPSQQDQPYLNQPPTTVIPRPVDVKYIALPDQTCCGTTTSPPTLTCLGGI